MEEALTSWQKQPGEGTVVWQHNRLAEARYELSPREQKLVLYVIAMIEPEDADFKRYVVNISDFARLANLSKDDLYRELRELAEGLKSKVLLIPDHFDTETGKTVKLITSWFSDALISPNGEGYFAVEISRNLKPYLLQVKREFYQFKLQQVMRMRSAYGIRLYQWLKRWQFRRKMQVTVADLRGIMGAAQPSKRGKVVNSLVPYADFKRRAVQPAIEEINEKSDILVGFSEIKAKGSKAVESLAFTIMSKSSCADVELMPLPSSPQLQLSLSEDPDEEERLVGEVKVKYALSHVQAEKVRAYLRSKGVTFVREKMEVVDREPRPNVARTLLAALRDDWQLPVKSRSSKSKVEKLIPINDEIRSKHAAEFAKLKESLRVG
ncbi:MAG TPA: replication initiation protein [Terrimicrobiaceae bacterium]